MRHRGPILLLVVLLHGAVPAQERDSLIGTRPPEWQVADWLHSKPLRLRDLRGKVVLVRWWTAPQCPYCRATAPALNEFHRRYSKQGLSVLAFYHHKSSAPLDVATVHRQAKEFGFQFPVAIDRDWKTLQRWWLDRKPAAWTSVTFLLDRRGVIRHIHPGGQYVKGDNDYKALQEKIEELLREDGSR